MPSHVVTVYDHDTRRRFATKWRGSDGLCRDIARILARYGCQFGFDGAHRFESTPQGPDLDEIVIPNGRMAR